MNELINEGVDVNENEASECVSAINEHVQE